MNEELLLLSLQRITQILVAGCAFAAIFFLGWTRPWAQKTNQKLAKWYSIEKLTKKLDMAIYIDEQLLKIRKLLSFISMLLVVILIYLSFRF